MDFKQKMKEKIKEYSNEKYLQKYIETEYNFNDKDADIYLQVYSKNELFDSRTVGKQKSLTDKLYIKYESSVDLYLSHYRVTFTDTASKIGMEIAGTKNAGYNANNEDDCIYGYHRIPAETCEKCGDLGCATDLTMYVPNNRKPEKIEHGRWSDAFGFEGADYVSWTDLDEYFVEYAKYPHKCDKCGGTMRILKEDDEIVCPECKVPLETADIIMWD
jgi:hypothetical protein